MSDGITLREFVHKIGFAVSLDGLNAYEKTLERLDTKTEAMYGGANKLIGRLESIGKAMSMRLTLPITALAGVSIAARVKQEEMQRTWGVLLPSMEQGIKFSKQLRELSNKTPFETEEINSYAKSLKSLQIPVKEIIPIIRKFVDIGAGTGANAGEMMNEYAMARLNPIMRGVMLRRLMMQGAVSQAQIRAAGIDPRHLRREGAQGVIRQDVFEKIFNQMYAANRGKGALQTDQLGKNLKNFWKGLENISAAIGGVIEKVLHLNRVLKLGSEIFGKIEDWIINLPGWVKTVTVGLAGFLAVLGPGMLLVSQFSKVILGLQIAFKFLIAPMLFNPVTLGIIAAISAAVMLLLVFRQINIEIRRWQGRDRDTVNEGKFLKAGGNLGQFTNASKGMASDATFARPVFGASSVPAARYVPRDIFGTGSPVVVHVHNPAVHLPPGTTAEHSAIIQSSHEEIIDKAIRKAVTQVHNARR